MIAPIVDKLYQLWFGVRHRATFRTLGSKTRMIAPFRIDGGKNMDIGAAVFVQRGSWLYCCGIDDQPSSLRIGDGCVLGYNNHIVAVRELVIGNEVLTANNVYISDNVHAYEDVGVPIMHQPVLFKQPVSIGAGSWLGENVCVVGASIGRNCVIGANAVVTRDIPDYSVAVGIPARVIRQFDAKLGLWTERAPK